MVRDMMNVCVIHKVVHLCATEVYTQRHTRRGAHCVNKLLHKLVVFRNDVVSCLLSAQNGLHVYTSARTPSTRGLMSMWHHAAA